MTKQITLSRDEILITSYAVRQQALSLHRMTMNTENKQDQERLEQASIDYLKLADYFDKHLKGV